MSQPAPLGFEVATADLVRAIEASSGGEERRRVIDLERRTFEYATSATLEHVTAVLSDGSTRRLVLKHPALISERALRAKPAFVLDPQREREVYRQLLTPMHVGPRLVGSTIAPQRGIYWLLIEEVDGHPLHEDQLDAWKAAARWTAGMHARFGMLDRAALQRDARLLKYDRGWYALWLDRARRFFSFEGPANSRRTSTSLRWLADRYDRVIDHLLSLPTTIIHGELYPSNVLISRGPAGHGIHPVDWEMAAVGPAIVDLAALTSGHWSDEDRRAILTAYAAASGVQGGSMLDEFVESVTYAQIHLSVQWLGWFGRRQATPGHARDWLSDAVDRAEALNL